MTAVRADNLETALTRTLRDYLETGRTRTDLLKTAADLIVELRSRHQTHAGETDWSGRSTTYRETIRRVYTAAGVTEDILDGVQSALRYHVGNAMRARVDAATLHEAGIRQAATPRARRQAYRAAQLAVLATVSDGTNMPAQRRLGLAEALLESVTPAGTFDKLDSADVAVVRETLDSIVVQVKTVRAALPKARRGVS